MKTKLKVDPLPREMCSFCGKYVRIEDRKRDDCGCVIHADSRDCVND